MAQDQFHELTVSGVSQQTTRAKAIRFDLPDALKSEFAFKPGQYLTVRANLDGEEVRRSYSICCSPGEGLEIGVKHLQGGVFSSFAQDLKAGDKIEVAAPNGRFVVETDGKHDYLLIAAGSEVNCVLRIYRYVCSHAIHMGVELPFAHGLRQVQFPFGAA